MDVFAWVADVQRELDDAGQSRLADLIDQLPSAVIDEDTDQVAAIVPEALALAREIRSPWIEIFVRHWDLQMRSGGRRDLHDAVELFELAHRDENLGCPQSVCAVQDLTLKYGATDDLGYAPERLEVSAEALRRIDPSWACYSCISDVHAGALVDSGRPQEALDFIATQAAAAASTGHELSLNDAVYAQVRALMALGRLDAALQALDRADEQNQSRSGRSFRTSRAFLRALCHAAGGDLEAARDALPVYDAIVDLPGHHGDWTRVAEQLVDGPWENEWQLAADIAQLLAEQVKQGRSRTVVNIATTQVRLALRRGAPATAARALAIARAEQPQLVAPHGADELLDGLQREIEAAPERAIELPDTPAALLESIDAESEDDADAERDADILAAAAERWPASGEIVQALATALSALGADDESEAALRGWLDRNPQDVDVRLQLASELLDGGRPDDAEQIASQMEAADAAWIRANIAIRAERYDEALAQAQIVCDARPEVRRARYLAAVAAMELREWETALARVRELQALDSDAPESEWLAMVAATALGDWETVRACAARLEFELEGDHGPIDEGWELIRVRFGGGARDPEYVAGRTGPVTARILEVAPLKAEQHVGDVVLLDSCPLVLPDADGDPEDESNWATWRALHVLSPAGKRTFELDGLHPGEQHWHLLRDGLRDAGCSVSQQSRKSYELDVDGEGRPGIYALVAIGPQTSDAGACALLTQLTGEHDIADLLWPALAEAAGADELAARQRERARELAVDMSS